MLKILILSHIWYYSTINGLDPKLVESIVQTESSFRPEVTGSVGERGLMQIKPQFLLGPLTQDLYDPETNIAIGCAELAKLKRLKPRLGDYWFVAWNLGPTGAIRYSNVYDISNFAYAKKIDKHYPKSRAKPFSPIKVASN